MTTAENIESYLEQFGVSYTRQSEEIWITGVRTEVSNFQIFIRLTEDWVFLFVNPLVVAPKNNPNLARFYFHALRYNQDMNLAKLGLDSDGDLFLIVEFPNENFAFSHFQDAMNALAYHASTIYLDLLLLGHRPEVVRGRYDTELAQTSNGQVTPPEDTESSDVLIAGRRLKITQDEDGQPRVELEDDDEEETPPAQE
ncbi:MAG: YbjN domain-containing protein [Anaerolineae bacterium]|nr:YbjN domain-containing protein [Anaerolineae bacterium]